MDAKRNPISIRIVDFESNVVFSSRSPKIYAKLAIFNVYPPAMKRVLFILTLFFACSSFGQHSDDPVIQPRLITPDENLTSEQAHFVASVAASNNSAAFEEFKLRCEMNDCAFINRYLYAFAKAVPPDSPLIPLFLDYFQDVFFNVYAIYAPGSKGYQTLDVGIINTRTGKESLHVSQAQAAALNPATEQRSHVLGTGDLAVLFLIPSTKAYDCLQRMLASAQFWQWQSSNKRELAALSSIIIPYEPLDYPEGVFAETLQPLRYEKSIIALYKQALDNPNLPPYRQVLDTSPFQGLDRNAKEPIIEGLFGTPISHAEVPVPAQVPDLSDADPSVHPQLLAFIADAEKQDPGASYIKDLERAKNRVLDLQKNPPSPHPAGGAWGLLVQQARFLAAPPESSSKAATMSSMPTKPNP